MWDTRQYLNPGEEIGKVKGKMQAARVRFLERNENDVSGKGHWCLSKRLLKKSGTINATYEKEAI
jgi:hypothetical protein